MVIKEINNELVKIRLAKPFEKIVKFVNKHAAFDKHRAPESARRDAQIVHVLQTSVGELDRVLIARVVQHFTDYIKLLATVLQELCIDELFLLVGKVAVRVEERYHVSRHFYAYPMTKVVLGLQQNHNSSVRV